MAEGELYVGPMHTRMNERYPDLMCEGYRCTTVIADLPTDELHIKGSRVWREPGTIQERDDRLELYCSLRCHEIGPTRSGLVLYIFNKAVKNIRDSIESLTKKVRDP